MAVAMEREPRHSLGQIFLRHVPARAVGFRGRAALDPQRLQLQKLLDFVGSHDEKQPIIFSSSVDAKLG